MVRLQAEPIRVETIADGIRRDEDGAVEVFLGTVRNHNAGRKVLHLEYHAYPEMAEAEMKKLEHQAIERYAVSGVAIVHRTGRLEIGDVSVAVVVTSAHRAPAQRACRFVIDTLKKTVPIWKKEYFEGGTVWIEGGERTSD